MENLLIVRFTWLAAVWPLARRFLMDVNEMITATETTQQTDLKGFRTGVYPEMPRHDYDSAPGVSHTMLKDWVAGKKTSPTRRLLVGNALHDRMLGRDVFDEKYTTIRDVNLTTTVGKAELIDAEKSTGRTAIREKERLLVASMFGAIQKNEMGKKYILSQGQREVAVFDYIGSDDSKVLPKHPTLMKGIIDLMGANQWDLKTCGWPTRDEFKNNIVNYGYASQAALYRELGAKACKGEYKRFFWLCVSIHPPHDVWVEEATPLMLAFGLRWIDTVLSLYERREAA